MVNFWEYLAGKNTQPFKDISDCNFGRRVIRTSVARVTEDNIRDVLANAMAIHMQNARECDYLDRYYRGDQPMLYRVKTIRPDVDNKVVVNLTQPLVKLKASEIAGEPIQYVLRGTDDGKSKQVAELNTIMLGEDKAYYDIELCEWRSICGTSYRFIGNDDANGSLLDDSDFYMSVEDPRYTFVVYYQNDRPALSCQIRKDADDKTVYYCYTNTEWFVVSEDGIESGINGYGAIPVIEYPNNSRRLSDIEITIPITDAINVLASDRINGIQQFVASFIKFVNCEMDEKNFLKLRDQGAFVVKSNNGSENKADVDIMSSELNQTEGQVVVSDLLQDFLVIQGLASRQGASGGDTGSAVELRNGHWDAEKQAEVSEPIFKRAERNMLRIVLNRLRITRGFTLRPSDVEIKISRSKMDNMLTKAETLQILLSSGINPARAIKIANLFADPEQVALESKDRMEILYPTEVEATEVVQNSNNGDNTTV